MQEELRALDCSLYQVRKSRVAGAALFGWSRSHLFDPVPAPTPTLLYSKYFIFTGP